MTLLHIVGLVLLIACATWPKSDLARATSLPMVFRCAWSPYARRAGVLAGHALTESCVAVFGRRLGEPASLPLGQWRWIESSQIPVHIRGTCELMATI